MTLPATFAAGPGSASLGARLGWACLNSLRAAFSLAPVAGREARGVALATVGLVALALLRALGSPARRARLVANLPGLAFGAAWWLAAAAAVAGVYPLWSPYRAVFGSVGLGLVLVLAVEPAGGLAVAGLAALRLIAFALAPGPPATISVLADENGAVLDFPRMVRLERLVVDARDVLRSRFPTLPHGAAVGAHAIPQLAGYAFADDHALQVWYADTTLRFVPYREFGEHPERALATFLEFQPGRRPQIALVAPEAMRLYLAGSELAEHGRLDAALATLARADSLQAGWPPAPTFSGSVAGLRALALFRLGRAAEAEREARRGLTLLPQNFGAEFLLAALAFQRGELDTAARYVDAVLAFRPHDPDARNLRDQVDRARRVP
jgi:tetratricopeptide (TPR) repeat protein